MADGMDLGKKVGPLPLGVWIAIVAGGLGLGWYINRNSSGGSTPAEESTGGLAAEPGVGTGGQQFVYDPPVTQPSTPTGYETNDQWARAAILYLLSESKDPTKSTFAINKYIAEMALSAEENALVGLAIKKLGPPPFLPSNPPEPPVVTPPTQPPTTPPAETTLTAPKNLRTWGNGASRLTVPLQWDAVKGAASYRVYRAGVATNINSSLDTKTTVGGLRPNTSYTFHVRAVSATGKLGPASAKKIVRTKK